MRNNKCVDSQQIRTMRMVKVLSWFCYWMTLNNELCKCGTVWYKQCELILHIIPIETTNNIFIFRIWRISFLLMRRKFVPRITSIQIKQKNLFRIRNNKNKSERKNQRTKGMNWRKNILWFPVYYILVHISENHQSEL